MRGWLRRFALCAPRVRALFALLLAELRIFLPEPNGTPTAAAVAAVLAAAHARGQQFSTEVGSPWAFACRMSQGKLLAAPEFL